MQTTKPLDTNGAVCDVSNLEDIGDQGANCFVLLPQVWHRRQLVMKDFLKHFSLGDFVELIPAERADGELQTLRFANE